MGKEGNVYYPRGAPAGQASREDAALWLKKRQLRAAEKLKKNGSGKKT